MSSIPHPQKRPGISSCVTTESIVQTNHRFVEVVASPGSGKTHTLVQRVAHLVRSGVSPNSILLLSFSNASVNELRHRLNALVPDESLPAPVASSNTAWKSSKWTGLVSTDQSPDAAIRQVHVSTLHAFALKVIPQSSTALLSEKAASALLKATVLVVARQCRNGVLWPAVSDARRQTRQQLLRDLAGHRESLAELNTLLSLARARGELPALTFDADTSLFPNLSAKNVRGALNTIAREYQRQKAKRHASDFDDLLVDATSLVTKDPDHPSHRQYTHVLVDEYQDSGVLQARLLAALARTPRRSVWVFGDPHQALYEFAGAGYTPLRDVLTEHKVVNLQLPVSRRLTACNAALAAGLVKTQVKTLPHRRGTPPTLVHSSCDAKQLVRLVRRVKHQVDDGAAPQQIVVLARTQAQLLAVEAALRAAGLRVSRLSASTDTSGRTLFDQVLRVLRLVQLVDSWSALRLRVERGAADDLRLLRRKVQRQLCTWDMEVEAAAFKQLMTALLRVPRFPSLEGRYRACRKAYLSILRAILDEAEHGRLVRELGAWEPMCRAYQSAQEMKKAIQHLPDGEVTTATIHAAKGGEWRHVHVVGVTDGLLPFYRARTEKALGEERRLLYVAVTRARDTLTLYHTPTRHNRSGQRFDQASRFLTKPVREQLRVVGTQQACTSRDTPSVSPKRSTTSSVTVRAH